MDFKTIEDRVRSWTVGLFVEAISGISSDIERFEIVAWLVSCRSIVESERTFWQKLSDLYGAMNMRRVVERLAGTLVEAFEKYKSSDLPLAVKISVPVTLAAVPLIGGQGAGLAAFGGGIGVPVILLVFLGSAGITSVIEAVVGSKDTAAYMAALAEFLTADEVLKTIKEAVESGKQGKPIEPVRAETPTEALALRETLLNMDPFDFERHVMHFFRSSGMIAAVTKRSNDNGYDGFARHPNGLIVVQCKRYSSDNPVGRPALQQFKGVIEETRAFKGYMVTTSRFTLDASKSAEMSDKIALVSMEELVAWHEVGPTF